MADRWRVHNQIGAARCWRVAVLAAAGQDQAGPQGRSLHWQIMKGSILQADLACVSLDQAVALGLDCHCRPGARTDRQTSGQNVLPTKSGPINFNIHLNS